MSTTKQETLEEIIVKRRLALNLSLKEVEGRTGIKRAHLQALEEGRRHQLPASVYVRGYLNQLSRLYHTNEEMLLAAFEESYGCARKTRQPYPSNQISESKAMVLVKKNLFRTVALSCFIAIFGYLSLQVYKVTAAPQLSIHSPSGNERIDQPMITLKGKASQNANVLINNQAVDTEASGEFNKDIYLAPGENEIVVRATNQFNKYTEVRRRVLVNYPTQVLGESDSKE